MHNSIKQHCGDQKKECKPCAQLRRYFFALAHMLTPFIHNIIDLIAQSAAAAYMATTSSPPGLEARSNTGVSLGSNASCCSPKTWHGTVLITSSASCKTASNREKSTPRQPFTSLRPMCPAETAIYLLWHQSRQRRRNARQVTPSAFLNCLEK